MFCVFISLYFWHLVDGVNIAVMEGDSVTLHTNDNVGYKQWRFGPQGTIILIQFNGGTTDITYFNDKRVRDRLQIDNQTGSLTIKNIQTTDTGLYELRMLESRLLFNVTVYARLPIPVITRDSSNCSLSSGSSNCSLVCSAVNVSHVTLSWYKENSVLSSISVSDPISSVSLPLEVDYQDNNIFNCVLNNPISNQTRHLDISQLCPTCADSVQCCGFTEAVIRLVISAVVGVATVAIVIYDITSRRAEQKQRTVPE